MVVKVRCGPPSSESFDRFTRQVTISKQLVFEMQRGLTADREAIALRAGEEQLRQGQSPVPPLAKGQAVVIPDGSKGSVAHVIDNMKSFRVKTDDGRNLTVRQSAVKPADSVLVKAHYRGSPAAS